MKKTGRFFIRKTNTESQLPAAQLQTFRSNKSNRKLLILQTLTSFEDTLSYHLRIIECQTILLKIFKILK